MDSYLLGVGADGEAGRFCRDLAEDGVAVIDLGDAGRELCDQALKDTRTYFDDSSVYRVQDAWRRSKAVRRLATFPKVLDRLRLAYGRRPFPFQTLNFERGSEQDIHCDAIHFHSEPERFMCGVWVALEDISEGAGPLEYVVGSHKLPMLTMQGGGVNTPDPQLQDYGRHYLPALQARLSASGLPRARAVLKKGQALVWAANLAHGGSRVTDPASTRRSLVTHYFFEDCLYYTPMISNPAAGRMALRLPPDVTTRGWVWPRRNGRRAPVKPKVFFSALKASVLQTPVVFRHAVPRVGASTPS